MPLERFAATIDNPCINLTGQATITQDAYCTWMTPNGATSVLVVTNADPVNSVTFVISGAPPEMRSTDGEPLNGKATIPPNRPTMNVTGIGDFQGRQVIIFNMSTPAATVKIVAVGSGGC